MLLSFAPIWSVLSSILAHYSFYVRGRGSTKRCLSQQRRKDRRLFIGDVATLVRRSIRRDGQGDIRASHSVRASHSLSKTFNEHSYTEIFAFWRDIVAACVSAIFYYEKRKYRYYTNCKNRKRA